MHRESKTPDVYAELFHRHSSNPILTARDWPYPAHAVFNAGACQLGDETVLLVRVEDRGRWIIAYTALSPGGPLVSLAETKDFVSFSRLGPVMPPEDKDAAVFPRRFGNRYAMIHRPVSTGSSGAHIWISFSPDLIHWGDHHILMHARRGAWWDANKIGLTCLALATAQLADVLSYLHKCPAPKTRKRAGTTLPGEE